MLATADYPLPLGLQIPAAFRPEALGRMYGLAAGRPDAADVSAMSSRFCKATKEEVAELMSKEVTLPAIAERLGVNKNRIYQLAKQIRDDLGWQAK